jgi:adenine specific DNA methylase Mod
MNQKEKLFFNQLKDIFIGAKIDGDSGFINLMRIKSAYFDVIFKELIEEIEEKTAAFPGFKEEMFDKLYTFFKTYFSESGSIYFSYTPLKSNVYEKVYTNNKDVVLFWKTHMLYYVKTDKLWNNLTVDFDEEGVKYKLHFDVSKLEHKKANEKRAIIYELKNIENKEITFNVLYSERGSKTKTDEILRAFKKNNIFLDEERLTGILRVFEKQNEVDYFINKDAEKFLKEQFDLWIKTYVLDDKSIFDEKRLKELKVLKDIAHKVIDFVSQFEDELVKIWNKPKFVLNSNYVITLDRIAEKEGGVRFIKEKILNNTDIDNQIEEWRELGIIKEDIEWETLFLETLNGKKLNDKFRYLPIDTKHFDDEIKFKLLSLFDDLDNQLDGWLIHSENYQALNTILPKFREKVQTIYIDPPFNLGTNADFLYNVNYKDSSWVTILENRINLARDLINEKGSMFVRCDYNGNMYVRLLMNDIFKLENFRNEIILKRGKIQFGDSNKYTVANESLFWYSKTDDYYFEKFRRPRYKHEPIGSNMILRGERFPRERKFYDKENKPHTLLPPDDTHFKFIQTTVDEMTKKGLITLKKSRKDFESGYKELIGNNWEKTDLVPSFVFDTDKSIDTNWSDISGYSQTWDFETENSEKLLLRVMKTGSKKNDLILDFFLGSGTTTAVAHKLGRKWLGVEMGEHFYTIVLPRMKKVLAYDKSGISKEVKDYKGGGFFKYYELEQYEQTLKKVVYKESHPFLDFNDKSVYRQYVFMKDLKLLEAVELDCKNNKINIDFSKIYPGIDLTETLSNLTGKAIKKATKEYVVFDDGEKIEFDNLDFNLIKPLIWW